MTFGEWLRTKINDKKLSNAELARRVGVSATYIGNLLRDYSPNTKKGVGRPSEDVVARLAAALGANANEARIAAGYAAEKVLPPFLYEINFAAFTRDDLREIEDFIRFKLSQKVQRHAPQIFSPEDTAALLDPDHSVEFSEEQLLEFYRLAAAARKK